MPARAIAVNTDIEPPEIIDKSDQTGAAGKNHVFNVVVVDDVSVDSVRLFYRKRGESSYRSSPMKQVGDANQYTLQIDLDAAPGSAIEYYLAALDSAGNRTLSGYAFDPIVRRIQDAPSATELSTGTSEENPGMSKKNKVWLTVLGVLTVGALANLASQSSSNGSSNSADAPSGGCDNPTGCRVNLTILSP